MRFILGLITFPWELAGLERSCKSHVWEIYRNCSCVPSKGKKWLDLLESHPPGSPGTAVAVMGIQQLLEPSLPPSYSTPAISRREISEEGAIIPH